MGVGGVRLAGGWGLQPPRIWLQSPGRGLQAAADDDALDEQEAKGFRMYGKANRSRVEKHMPHFSTDEILVELRDRWDALSEEHKHKYNSLAATRDDECMR